MPKTPKQIITMRLRPEIEAWSKTVFSDKEGGRTALVEYLLDAYRQHRLVVLSEPVSAAPAPTTFIAPHTEAHVPDLQTPEPPRGDTHMRVEIVAGGCVLPTHQHKGEIFAEAPKKGTYAIRIYNDSPSRKLAVVSVDGLSVLDGQVASPNGEGYVIMPWQTVEIPGWRRDAGKAAAFEFAEIGKSYSAQVGKGRDNVGVIGVAVFAEKVKVCVPSIIREVHHHHHDRWWPWYNPPTVWLNGTPDVTYANNVALDSTVCSVNSVESTTASNSLRGTRSLSTKSASKSAPQDIGTGYGDEVSFQTTDVAFERASTEPCETIRLRYATRERLKSWGVNLSHKAKTQVRPNPFPASPSVPAPPGWGGR